MHNSIQPIRYGEIVPEAPIVIILAMQCWKPQKINSGTPKKIPNRFFSLYILTARYIIIPQNTDFKKKGKDIV